VRGSTRKRGRTWTALWDVPPDPHTGERRQKSKGGFKTRKAAQEHLAVVITDVNDGTYSEPSKLPLAFYLADEWLPAIKGTVRPLTHRRYAAIVRTYIAGRDIGAVPLRALSPGHVNGWLGELEQAGLSVATRRLAFAVLRRGLADGARWEKVRRNAAAAADPPSLPRSRVQSWTATELRKFLAHVADDRLATLWRAGAMTGMRRGELLGPTWRALDLDGATLRVDQQVIPEPGVCEVCGDEHSVTLAPPKSRRGERTIALDAETVAALRRHRDTQLLERDLAGDAYADHDLVFCDELGGPIHPQRATDWFPKLRKSAGIPTGSLHVLRHTHATLLLTDGVPLHVVAARLGDDPKTVLTTYAHLLPTSDAMAAQAVAALVDNPLTDTSAARAVEPNPAP
jgi:integrase